ncbi:chromosome partitioning protein ParA [Prauserella marina]|uniref:Cellulose biosynthesis protein BcsQ n=1 Tax=Prauserella marina TaxID=530584 RepID=A0A222VNE8_9PSEU|nr:ParA family protein [Prauserella marina]ASR35372.1 chromosome partitioning protein ParA [Prauserella marina]PWV84831.1 cellulose biosynthesis protein BcsQ [Prauserella marina]SDC12002.1 Cellulose biosynthesis protein BcsQ [Prauserella marina]
MHTVAVLSLKGGVGKTTVALGIASAALRRGVRALVGDLDPQGNATASLDPPMTESTLADVLETPRLAVINEALAPSAWSDSLDVLVGSEELELLNEPGPESRRMDNLARALDELRAAREDDPYELAILDCPPSLGRLTRSALMAADTALLVTEPTMYAVAGAERALEAIETVREEQNPRLRPAGVLVNKLRARSYEHQYRIAELRESFGRLVMPTAIPDRLAIQQAQGACTPIHEWKSPGAQEIALTFNMVLAKILRSSRAGRHRLDHTESGELETAEQAPDYPGSGPGQNETTSQFPAIRQYAEPETG